LQIWFLNFKRKIINYNQQDKTEGVCLSTALNWKENNKSYTKHGMHARPKAALVLQQLLMAKVHKYTQHYETES
jgi:hypothetical protein